VGLRYILQDNRGLLETQSIGNIRYSLMPYKDKSVRKSKAKEYSRKHYEKTQEETKQRNAQTRKKGREAWNAFKATLACSNCGFNHPAALDFHHEDPNTKTGNVHKFAGDGRYKKAYEEIKQCIVLCANCHRIHHHEEKMLHSNQ